MTINTHTDQVGDLPGISFEETSKQTELYSVVMPIDRSGRKLEITIHKGDQVFPKKSEMGTLSSMPMMLGEGQLARILHGNNSSRKFSEKDFPMKLEMPQSDLQSLIRCAR